MKKQLPKVIFLTKYPPKGASSRYRVYQYLPYFNRFRYVAQSLLSDASYRLLYQKGMLLSKVWQGVKDYMRRAVFLWKHKDADVVYMQRELFAFGTLWAEHWFKKRGKKIILDLDDALFINKKNHNNPFRFDKASRVKKIIALVDVVIAGNRWIKEECIALGAKRVVHIDVAEAIRFENIQRAPSFELKALWLGSPTTSKYLYYIEEVLYKFQQQYGLEITIVGGDPTQQFKFKATTLPWTKENEERYLSTASIGLMPLPMEKWSKGKCGGKARTYMASGLIPLVSNIGYNKELIVHSENGFLCSNEQDWFTYLERLHHHRYLQERIRATNYASVKEKFAIDTIADELSSEILKPTL